jgi:hypothetical protein
MFAVASSTVNQIALQGVKLPTNRVPPLARKLSASAWHYPSVFAAVNLPASCSRADFFVYRLESSPQHNTSPSSDPAPKNA